jgi:hypothetical protein
MDVLINTLGVPGQGSWGSLTVGTGIGERRRASRPGDFPEASRAVEGAGGDRADTPGRGGPWGTGGARPRAAAMVNGRDRIVRVDTVDKMTDRQIAAKVRHYYFEQSGT